MTRISKQTESGEQMAFIRFCRMLEGQIPELRWIYHIPNGGKRDAITGSKLWYEGVKRGVWDLHLPVPRNGKPGLWIEMKVGTNDLEPEQAAFRSFLLAHGHEAHICRAWHEAAAIVLRYLGYNPDEYDLAASEDEQ